MLAKSILRCGRMVTMAPRKIPMDPMFAKPHRAYVAITLAFSVWNRWVKVNYAQLKERAFFYKETYIKSAVLQSDCCSIFEGDAPITVWQIVDRYIDISVVEKKRVCDEDAWKRQGKRNLARLWSRVFLLTFLLTKSLEGCEFIQEAFHTNELGDF